MSDEMKETFYQKLDEVYDLIKKSNREVTNDKSHDVLSNMQDKLNSMFGLLSVA